MGKITFDESDRGLLVIFGHITDQKKVPLITI